MKKPSIERRQDVRPATARPAKVVTGAVGKSCKRQLKKLRPMMEKGTNANRECYNDEWPFSSTSAGSYYHPHTELEPMPRGAAIVGAQSGDRRRQMLQP